MRSSAHQLIIGYALILLLLGSGILVTENIFTRYEQLNRDATLQENQALTSELERVRVVLEEFIQAKPNSEPNLVQAVESQGVAINQVGLAELDALPGIGEVRARAILEERDAHGPFQDGPDLRDRVTKLPQSVYEVILPQLDFQVSE